MGLGIVVDPCCCSLLVSGYELASERQWRKARNVADIVAGDIARVGQSNDLASKFA